MLKWNDKQEKTVCSKSANINRAFTFVLYLGRLLILLIIHNYLSAPCVGQIHAAETDQVCYMSIINYNRSTISTLTQKHMYLGIDTHYN